MVRALLLSAALAGASFQAFAAAQPCDEEFQRTRTFAAHERLPWWKKLEGACRKSQRYFLVGGLLAKEVVRSADAISFLKDGLRQGGPYNDPISSELAQLYFEQGDKVTAETIADALIRKSPAFPGGYWQKATVLLERKAYPEAIAVLTAALKAEEHAHTYSFLAIAYSLSHNDLEAARAMQRALKLDKAELENVLAICATAYSLVRIDQIPAAEDLLAKHLTVRPESASNEEYRRATLFVQEYVASKP